MRERLIENRLCQRVREYGGKAYKFNGPGRRARPDRVCCIPGANIWFVECKATGEEPTAAQWREINRLVKMGFNATYVNSYEMIDELFPPHAWRELL